jgi:hypothetical protein
MRKCPIKPETESRKAAAMGDLAMRDMEAVKIDGMRLRPDVLMEVLARLAGTAKALSADR